MTEPQTPPENWLALLRAALATQLSGLPLYTMLVAPFFRRMLYGLSGAKIVIPLSALAAVVVVLTPAETAQLADLHVLGNEGKLAKLRAAPLLLQIEYQATTPVALGLSRMALQEHRNAGTSAVKIELWWPRHMSKTVDRMRYSQAVEHGSATEREAAFKGI